jgi:hypothetical protein
MPDRDVETIRDLIFYQYAKIMARRAFAASDGKEAKKQHYGFIKKTFRELKSGVKSWSEITREDWQFVEADKRCIYCGSEAELHREHIVPKSLSIRPECGTCDVIQGMPERFRFLTRSETSLCNEDGSILCAGCT